MRSGVWEQVNWTDIYGLRLPGSASALCFVPTSTCTSCSSFVLHGSVAGLCFSHLLGLLWFSIFAINSGSYISAAIGPIFEPHAWGWFTSAHQTSIRHPLSPVWMHSRLWQTNPVLIRIPLSFSHCLTLSMDHADDPRARSRHVSTGQTNLLTGCASSGV